MSKKRILFGMVTVALLATMTSTVQAEIRRAQLHRVEQLTESDVVLQDANIQDSMQSDLFRQAVANKDKITLEVLTGIKQTAAFSKKTAPQAWTEVQKQLLERRVRHEISDDYGQGGPF